MEEAAAAASVVAVAEPSSSLDSSVEVGSAAELVEVLVDSAEALR